MLIAYAINECSHAGQQAIAEAGFFETFPHPLAHVADYAVRQISTRGAANLGKEFRVVGGNYQQQAAAACSRPAHIPLTGGVQRIIVEVFAARRLDRDDCKVDLRLLLEALQHAFQTLPGRGVKHFRKIIDVASAFRQPIILRTRREIRDHRESQTQ